MNGTGILACVRYPYHQQSVLLCDSSLYIILVIPSNCSRRPWYHRAEINRGRLAVSGVYLDATPGVGKVITISRAIHKAKPLTPPDCTGKTVHVHIMI